MRQDAGSCVRTLRAWIFSFIRSDEGLALETSAFESLYGGQLTLSTQLIKPNPPGAWVLWDWPTEKDWNYLYKQMHDGISFVSAILFLTSKQRRHIKAL